MRSISKTSADMGLLSVTVFWGTTFILSKNVLEHVSLMQYLAVRLSLAAIFMMLIALPHRRALRRSAVIRGMILGGFLFASYFFQMWGIQYTSASKAGFITGLNVVLVPVFSILFFRDHPRLNSLIGVFFATIGLFYLSGGSFSGLNKGDWLVFTCAVTVTFHVILTGKFAPKENIYVMTAVQLITTAVLALIFGGFDDTLFDSIRTGHIWLLVYLALFGTVYTFLMQTAMQRFTTATRTALVFSMEPVFAALFAYLIAGETLSAVAWFGGALILCGMIVAELDWDALGGRRKTD